MGGVDAFISVCPCCVVLVLQVTPLPSAANDSGTVIPLSNGMTKLDLTGRQSESFAILAHRENFNAHSTVKMHWRLSMV